MRKWIHTYTTNLVSGILLLVMGCEKDAGTPCVSNDTFQGKICKEYRYQFSEYIGHISYEYMGDDLSRKSFITTNGKENSYVEVATTDTSISEHTYRTSDGSLVERRTSEYDQNGHLLKETVTTSTTETYTTFLYGSNWEVIAADHYSSAGLTAYDVYSYDTDDSLYKISSFDRDSVLTSFVRFEYFPNITRKNEYDQNFVFVGHEISLYEDGLLKKRQSFDGNGILEDEEEYEYDANGLLLRHAYSNSSGQIEWEGQFVYY